jgi:hypothetical protein
MNSSNFAFDANPQYRDLGCPSQCMGQNEYSTVANIYSFDTSPETTILSVPQVTVGSQSAGTAPTTYARLNQIKNNVATKSSGNLTKYTMNEEKMKVSI